MINVVIEKLLQHLAARGTKRVSVRTLRNLFNEYMLTDDERKQVIKFCKANGIIIYSDGGGSIEYDDTALIIYLLYRHKIEEEEEKIAMAQMEKAHKEEQDTSQSHKNKAFIQAAEKMHRETNAKPVQEKTHSNANTKTAAEKVHSNAPNHKERTPGLSR